MMVGLTISKHFQQFENLKNQEPLQSVQPSRIRRDYLDFTWESRIPTRLQSEHEYPNSEKQLSQANEQTNI